MVNLKNLIIAAVAITGVIATSNLCHAQAVRTAQIADFDELFVVEDTIRLDQSVLIGRIDDLDINVSGEMLVVDDVGNKVYHFSATGRLLHELSVADCHPGGMPRPHSARFLGDGQIIMWDTGNVSTYLFDSNGQCVQHVKSPDLININGMCAHGDKIFAMPIHSSLKAKAFSRDLDLLDEFELEPERWPVLITSILVRPGHSLECFDDGPWYVYIYSMDATPIGREAGFSRYEPAFFVERKRDIRRPVPTSLIGANDASNVVGLYRLDNSTRIVVHSRIRHRNKWLSDWGLTIVSHKNLFPSVSVPLFPRKGFKGGANGMLYFQGDHEPLEDGLLGNPELVRYRFIPPKNVEE